MTKTERKKSNCLQETRGNVHRNVQNMANKFNENLTIDHLINVLHKSTHSHAPTNAAMAMLAYYIDINSN